MGFIVVVALAILLVVPFWKIYTRLGFHPGLAVLMLIPLAGHIVLYYVAYTKWPNRPFEHPLSSDENFNEDSLL